MKETAGELSTVYTSGQTVGSVFVNSTIVSMVAPASRRRRLGGTAYAISGKLDAVIFCNAQSGSTVSFVVTLTVIGGSGSLCTTTSSITMS